jgi:hypothetical protein
MHAAKVALVAADKVAEVNIFPFIFILAQNTQIYILQSPRFWSSLLGLKLQKTNL